MLKMPEFVSCIMSALLNCDKVVLGMLTVLLLLNGCIGTCVSGLCSHAAHRNSGYGVPRCLVTVGHVCGVSVCMVIWHAGHC